MCLLYIIQKLKLVKYSLLFLKGIEMYKSMHKTGVFFMFGICAKYDVKSCFDEMMGASR